jgi:hypothetical protein
MRGFLLLVIWCCWCCCWNRNGERFIGVVESTNNDRFLAMLLLLSLLSLSEGNLPIAASTNKFNGNPFDGESLVAVVVVAAVGKLLREGLTRKASC